MTDKNANKIGYKKTKLGWIPEDWEILKIRDIVDKIETGVSVNSESRPAKSNEFGILKTSCVKDGIFRAFENKFILEQELKRAKLHPCRNCIIVSRMNTPELVGENAYIPEDYKNLYIPDRLWQIYINNKTNSKWLSYITGSKLFKRNLKLEATGTSNSMKNIAQESFLSQRIIFPTKIEQDKIAEVLSCWDNGIEVLEKLLEKKQLLKKALMQGLLSGKIPLKNSKKNNSYKKTILGEIPSNWTVVKLKNIFTRLEEKNSKKNMLPVLTNSATQGVIYQNEYFDRSIVSETNTNNYYIVYPNAFMYNPRISKNAPAGPINKNKLGEIGIASPLYTIFYSKNDLCNSFYELYFNTNLWNKYMLNVANQGARHDRLNVTTKDFINMPLPCPPINEQQEIVEVLSSYDEEIKLLDKKLEMLKLQKKGLMQKLLTGEIRVKI